jgi:8-oxo-dGTP diphosphatase
MGAEMNSDQPLYQRDPAAWEAHLAEGNARQPRKRVSADVLLTDSKGALLLVNPKYKPGWDLPGGMVEANEAPKAAVRRELFEELGFPVQPATLLCIDWVTPHGPWDDLLAFVFDGGDLTRDTVSRLVLSDGELADFEFFTAGQARLRLPPHVWRRTTHALDALATGTVYYLQDGHPA